MQKSNQMLLLTVLLVTAALSSCKKEEIKKTAGQHPDTRDIKSLARNNNYIRSGIYYEGPGGMFSTCLFSGPCCMVVVRPVIGFNSGGYLMTPEEGEDLLQVDKYKESGIESAYYSSIDVTVDQNGQETYHYNP